METYAASCFIQISFFISPMLDSNISTVLELQQFRIQCFQIHRVCLCVKREKGRLCSLKCCQNVTPQHIARASSTIVQNLKIREKSQGPQLSFGTCWVCFQAYFFINSP
ncbi:hypothetical protein FGO68_gene8299 [Halteria grandinella]|uniref:Uncharacterized protein n=1 Tax=Halteria grandinella TaxID=5974 RepID=A0A8J8NAX5_HALGN|nr:hypothetical protein FGO68_gene8299 [Halteria grandinella]